MLRVTVVATGRLKAGPERELATRYIERATLAGRQLGVVVDVRELDESRARRAEERKREEAEALRAAVPGSAVTVVLDEVGRTLDSPGFAELFRAARDAGRNALIVVIGGPDGLDAEFRRAADHVVAFGAMTWPHQLVRVMAAEQIYRAVTILAGHPYHRA